MHFGGKRADSRTKHGFKTSHTLISLTVFSLQSSV